MEVQIALSSLTEWKDWLADNSWAVDPHYIEDLVACTQIHGILSPFLGRLPAADIEVLDSNYRESLLARGLNPRARAVLDYIAETPEASETLTTRIYAPEGLTPFALALRGRYPKFLGSEYTENPETAKDLFPIPNENLLNLSFPDASFDLVVCNDLFEHVPDLPRAAREIARIIRPRGVLLATFPFSYDQPDTLVKAYLGARFPANCRRARISSESRR